MLNAHMQILDSKNIFRNRAFGVLTGVCMSFFFLFSGIFGNHWGRPVNSETQRGLG